MSRPDAVDGGQQSGLTVIWAAEMGAGVGSGLGSPVLTSWAGPTLLLPEVPGLDLLCRPGSFPLFRTQQFRKAASALRCIPLDFTALSNCAVPVRPRVTLRCLSKWVLGCEVPKHQTVWPLCLAGPGRASSGLSRGGLREC